MRQLGQVPADAGAPTPLLHALAGAVAPPTAPAPEPLARARALPDPPELLPRVESAAVQASASSEPF